MSRLNQFKRTVTLMSLNTLACKGRRLGIVLLTVLLSADIADVFAQSEGSSTVNCGSNGVDLQTKITNASLGATVYVTGACAGGPYVINRDIKLVAFGENGATLSSPNGAKVLIVQGAVLRVEGVRIQGGTEEGILLHGGTLFANNIVVHGASGDGVRIGVNSHATITNSAFRNNVGFGIQVTESSGAFLQGNTLEQNAIGISVDRSSSAIVDGNTIRNNTVKGVIVESNASILLLNNSISNNAGGGLLVRRNGFVDTVNPPNTFSGNGIDVECLERGIVDAVDGPQQPATGAFNTDGLCLIIGTVF
jgi:parallel beta-helix repeat protein